MEHLGRSRHIDDVRAARQIHDADVTRDVDGDASADFQILCTGVITFTVDDFLL